MENEHEDSMEEERGIVVAPPREIINVEQAVAEWEAYQELTRRLLTEDDYQRIGNKKFKRKSAWRKYARAFDVSCERILEEIVRADDGFPTYARLWVRATDKTGARWQDAEQECHIRERCCQQPCSKRKWTDHYCCPVASADGKVKGCDGRRHWSHPGDLPATAFTRAKNRAISDLIGAGEVSAEEMIDGTAPEPSAARRPAGRRPTAKQAAAQAAHEGASGAEPRESPGQGVVGPSHESPGAELGGGETPPAPTPAITVFELQDTLMAAGCVIEGEEGKLDQIKARAMLRGHGIGNANELTSLGQIPPLERARVVRELVRELREPPDGGQQ